MNVSFLIAKRYFLSKKKRNIISIIANIAMGGVAVGTMSLIIVLSVFNGLEDLIRQIYGSFDPHLKVSAVKGKSFEPNAIMLERIRQTPGVVLVTEVIEDNALLRYDNRQMVVKMKGVSDNFFGQNEIDSSIVEGSHVLREGEQQYALMGRGVQHQLSVNVGNSFKAMHFLYPKNKISLNPEGAFRSNAIMPGGVFAIERQYDDSYVFVPLEFAKNLLGYEGKLTSIEVKAESKQKIDEVKKRLQELLGPEFQVQNSEEQHVSLLRAVKVEKMFVFLTFAFILLIASLNIFFSLSMLVIDKKKDLAILASMGATAGTIRKIFLMEGAIVAFSGAIIGLLAGMLICQLQQTFGLVSMGMETAIVDAYPVKMAADDFIFTGLAIIVITLLVSIRPANKAASNKMLKHL